MLLSTLDFNVEHEGVLGDLALSDRIVVARARVHASLLFLLGGSLHDRLEVQHRHEHLKLHHFRLHQLVFVKVPLGSFQVQTRNVGTILSILLNVLNGPIDRNKVKVQLINRGSAWLSAISLVKTSSKTGWVSESTDPEDIWGCLGSPVGKEGVSLIEVLEPRGQRLEGEVGETPVCGHSVLVQSLKDCLQLW